jgi:GTP-binding protein
LSRVEEDLDLEAGRLLFAGPIAFERGAVSLDGLPDPDRAEVAFAGRSNVGKSSLINGLANRKNLARASSAPGRTRELNFFLVGDHLRVVDLPGYGYASAPKDEIKRWTGLMRDYLRGRPGLKRVFLLVDSRHGLKTVDGEIMDALDTAAAVYQVVLTKIDKLSTTERTNVETETIAAIKKRPAAHPLVLAVSSLKGDGIETLRAEIAALT